MKRQANVLTQLRTALAAQGAGLALSLLLIAYCGRALTAPFIGGDDMGSNLLPILHYRHSLLIEHQWPGMTELWYGGRLQWQNPLWNFLYLPATLLWLIFPLRVATALVVVGHLLFAGWAALRLAGLYVQTQVERLLVALLLLSPIIIRLRLGHVENIMAWPWVLLGLYYLLVGREENAKPGRRGLVAGLCLGIIPLTGANYYALYAAVLFAVLLWGHTRRFVASFAGGAALGLLHVPSVTYLWDTPRQFEAASVEWYRIRWGDTLYALFIGPPRAVPYEWESFALLGLGFVPLLVLALFRPLTTRQRLLAVAIALELLLATAVIYPGLPLLNTFRVPARAMAFVAIALVLLVLIGWRTLLTKGGGWRWVWRVALVVACLQLLWVWRGVRPFGSPVWLDNGSTELAQKLTALGAQSVWFEQEKPRDTLIPLALTEAGIALPNVYYGQMGQTIPVAGEYCGFSFDYLVTRQRNWPEAGIPLQSDTFPQVELGSIAPHQVVWVESVDIEDRPLQNFSVHIFAVRC